MALPIGDINPVQVLWNGVDLGPTFGGVKFNEELTKKEIFEDGHGKTPVDAVFTGRLTSVVAKFTRSSLTQLEAMIESSTAGANNLKVVNSVGNAMFASSEELILKKLVDNTPSVLPAEWLHVHRTYPIAKPSFDFDNDNQRLIEVEFMCFPDDFSTQVNEIWRMGPAS
jgi:hypothetical protein